MFILLEVSYLSTYVWCEDSGAGFTFWKKVFEVLYSDFIVETKKNNSELCKAADKICEDDNIYYILMDYAIDNTNVLRETQRLYHIIKSKKNVKVIKIHSFEFVLLSFKNLIEWIFDKNDELKIERSQLLDIKDRFVDLICNGGDSIKLQLLKDTFSFPDSMNTEKISANLLYKITRNTGFETSKGKLGECFIVDCCNWEAREADDICGLDQSRISAEAKITNIVKNSVLNDSFLKVGL